MALIDVSIDIGEARLPSWVDQLVAEATLRMDSFVHANRDAPLPAFVPSDFAAVFATLQALRSDYMVSGDRFCEWGSGFGIVAMIASGIGFRSTGIEIEPALVEQARQLAVDLQIDVPIDVNFAEGSFIPSGGERFSDSLDDLSWLDTGGEPVYEALGLEPDDFDVVFVYPWPGEERFVADLFDHVAAPGALLVSYHGLKELRIRRKRGRSSA